MMSKDRIDEHILKISAEDQYIERGKIINDLRDEYRHTSIADEGTDPAKMDEPTDVEESLNNIKSKLRSNSNKGGRPKEGGTYKKDSHPYGRDPLGNEERKNALANRTSEVFARKVINGVASKREFINEDTTMLDDNNILDDTKN